MNEQERKKAVEAGLIYPDPEKDGTPMIELHKVDTAMAYAAKIVKDVKIIVAICLFTVITVVFIFVSKYNERTSDWLKTFNLLRTGQAEVQNEDTGTIQQLPPS